MRTRALTLVALMLLMLAAAPQFEAMPTGIGAAGDNGCTCHGGASGDTSVIVEGLPERFNASETYPFTVTVVYDVMELHNGGSTEGRSEEHTSELQSLKRRSYAGFCLKKKKN